MKLSFFLFVNFVCGAANIAVVADQSLRGGESNTGGITSTNIRSLQMNDSPLKPGESNCDLHSDLDGSYVCSVRSNGSVNDVTYNPETHLACVTSGGKQYCANIGLSESDPMMPGGGGGGDGGDGPGPDDMAPPDVEDDEAPVDDTPDVMPDEDMPVTLPVLDDEEEVDLQILQGEGSVGLMPNQGGGKKCPGPLFPTEGSHCGGWVPSGAIETSCYYRAGTVQCNCALQNGDDTSLGWQCRPI